MLLPGLIVSSRPCSVPVSGGTGKWVRVARTCRTGLELVAASEAYERLHALRGKVAFSIDLERLRDDRR